MHLRRIFALAALALGCAVLPTAAWAGPRVEEVAQFPFPLGDPGPQPAFRAEDYAGYIGQGNASFVADFHTPMKSGKVIPWIEQDAVALYPDTPFMRWVVIQYARLTDGADHFHHVIPGYGGYPLQLPDYLISVDYAHSDAAIYDKAARHPDHCQNGVCVWTGLQPKSYILWGEQYVYTPTSATDVRDEGTYNPVLEEHTIHETRTTRYYDRPTAGFILVSGRLTMRGGETRHALPGSIKPAAYFTQ